MDSAIVYGTRGKEFRDFISLLLRKGKVRSSYIENFLDTEAMDLYAQAFTNPTANENENYEFLEKIGDATCNKAIIWYIYRKFPKLKQKPQGLMIFSRLFHLLQSTQTFSRIALHFQFEKYISYGQMRVKDRMEDVMKIKRNGVLEDCFEAFFGATEYLIDQRSAEGVGYAICNAIFKGMIEDFEFPSIKYEDLFDPITRLKELFDYNFAGKGKLGKHIYDSVYDNDENSQIKTVVLYWIDNAGKKTKIATGTGSLKEKAKAVAAEQALVYFKNKGYEKSVPYDYRDFL